MKKIPECYELNDVRKKKDKEILFLCDDWLELWFKNDFKLSFSKDNQIRLSFNIFQPFDIVVDVANASIKERVERR